MIVRNEELHLSRCLHSVRGLADEIVVVDTGSADATMQRARELGALVVELPWPESFAAARTESVRQATGDWILYLDADEFLDEANRAKFVRFKDELVPNSAYLLRQHSPSTTIRSGPECVVDHVRLFPNLPGLQWMYRVHEQVLPNLMSRGCTLRPSGLVFSHSGYCDASLLNAKRKRNLSLLLRDLEEWPNDGYLWFNLGIDHFNDGLIERAAACFAQSIELTAGGASYLPHASAMLIRSYVLLQKWLDAELASTRAIAAVPNDLEILCERGNLFGVLGRHPAAIEAYQRAIQIGAVGAAFGVAPETFVFRSHHELARIFKRMGKYAEALSEARQAVKTCPESLSSWSLIGELLTAQNSPRSLEALIAECRMKPFGESVFPILSAHRHLLAGQPGRAIGTLLRAVAAQPEVTFFRLLLCELLIQEQRDPEDVRGRLRQVLAHEPGNRHALYLLRQVDGQS